MDIKDVRSILEKCIDDKELVDQFGRILGFTPDMKVFRHRDPKSSTYIEAVSRLGVLTPEILIRRNIVAAMVASIDDPLGRSVMSDRYLLFLTWDQIAERHHYSISTIFKLHNKFIEQIAARFNQERLTAI